MTVYFYKEFIKNMWHTYVSYICRSNPVFIRQHARFIMSANENARVSNQGYSAFTACGFFFSTGHIPSSLGVILRTTDKIVWANEFERELLENHTNLFNQSTVSFFQI